MQAQVLRYSRVEIRITNSNFEGIDSRRDSLYFSSCFMLWVWFHSLPLFVIYVIYNFYAVHIVGKESNSLLIILIRWIIRNESEKTKRIYVFTFRFDEIHYAYIWNNFSQTTNMNNFVFFDDCFLFFRIIIYINLGHINLSFNRTAILLA